MATPDLMQSVQAIRAALPMLEDLATLALKRDDLARSVYTLQGAVNALDARCRVQEAEWQDERAAGDAVRAQRAKEAKIAEGLLDERLKDLQRSQQAAEQALAVTRGQIERAVAQQAEDHAKREAAAQIRVAGIVRDGQAAAAQLAGIQERLTALHGTLAGLATP